MRRHCPALLLILAALLGGLLRFYPNSCPYWDLDAALYARAALQYHQALLSGAWLSQPLSNAYYTAVEYWPPLFPMLSGLLGGSTRFCAALCGFLCLIPAYFLGYGLWSRQRGNHGSLSPQLAGALVALLTALHPFLVWYARVPRTEALYLLLETSSLACLFYPGARGHKWRLGASGLCLGLAYCVRFDALLLLAATLLAAAFYYRPLQEDNTPPEVPKSLPQLARNLALILLGFCLAALPYLGYLAWLNNGVPTLVTPDKAFHDTLEGVWTKACGRSMYDFTTRFGLPGAFVIDRHSPEIRELAQTPLPNLMKEGLGRLPDALTAASYNWLLLLAPFFLSLPPLLARGKKAARLPHFYQRSLGAMLLLALPALPLAVVYCWDSNPRYYAFTILPLIILALRGLEWLADSPRPASTVTWAVVGLALPLQLAVAWIIPGENHFDQRGMTDPAFLELVPQAWKLRAAILALGLGTASLALWKLHRCSAGLLGFAAAFLGGAGGLLPLLGQGYSIFRTALAWQLLGLALFIGVMYATMPAARWGRSCALWLLGAILLTSWQNNYIMEMWGTAHSRLVHCPKASAYLQNMSADTFTPPPGLTPAQQGFGGGQGPRLMAYQQVDALRSGGRWVPLLPDRPLRAQILQARPDFILLALPEPGRGGNSVIVPEFERTCPHQLVGCWPAPWGPQGSPRWWRLYRIGAINDKY